MDLCCTTMADCFRVGLSFVGVSLVQHLLLSTTLHHRAMQQVAWEDTEKRLEVARGVDKEDEEDALPKPVCCRTGRRWCRSKQTQDICRPYATCLPTVASSSEPTPVIHELFQLVFVFKMVVVTLLLVFLLGSVSAIPLARLTRRGDPPATPVHLEYGPDPDGMFKCGDKSYSGHEIYLAVQYGINLLVADQTRGSKSITPGSCLATYASPVGQFPQTFNSSAASQTIVPTSYCPANNMRYDFPLANGLAYNGGPNDTNAGDERVVFFYRSGDISYDSHPVGYYCGIVTRKGAASNGFVLC